MSSPKSDQTFFCSPGKVKSYCRTILAYHGLNENDAEIVADSLVSANLRGVDSHGISRMGIYIDRIKHGLNNLSGDIEIIRDKGATILIDGKNGMGAPVTMKALQLGMKRAKSFGCCTVGIYNSTHYGAGAYYIKEAVRNNLIAHMYSNAPPTMAPWGGVDPYFGTNPYSFGAPAGKHFPVILDMASSVVARGKIIMKAREGKSIPDGWAIDKNGRPTNDANEALEGSVLPFAGPKGYGIALMIDTLAGILTSANFGPRIPDLYRNFSKPQNVGVFIQLTDIESFMNTDDFLKRMDQMVSEIKQSRKAPELDQIYLPGEIEYLTEQTRNQTGIPVEEGTFDLLKSLSSECDINFENVIVA